MSFVVYNVVIVVVALLTTSVCVAPLLTLNFLVLQWFGVRLGRVLVRHGSRWEPGGWFLLRWVWPLTGWWSPYRWIAQRGGVS